MRLVVVTVVAAISFQAAATQLTDVRLWAGPDKTRVVLDLTGPIEHSLFILDNPDRVVIDLRGVDPSKLAARDGKGQVERMRFGRRDGGARVVFDLNVTAKPLSFLLAPSGAYGHRLVVDIVPSAQEQPSQPSLVQPTRSVERPILVAIDPGHGGEDPGAIGPRGSRDKDIALQIGQRLADLLNREPGMRAVLTRDGDYYIPLRKRIAIAQQAGADLFVSIHADAFTDRRVRGSSVYVLSPRGASSEHARVLANRENAADLVGGVDLHDKDDLLASVLIDISQTAAIEASLDVAQRLLQRLDDLGPLHSRQVQRAGFAVLKAPDIPSILVETAFISNRDEERRLRDPQQQQKLARSLLDGIRGYFEDYRPQRVVAAANSAREHVVRRGDTLSEIAMRYGTSIARLRKTNDLRGDRLQVGDRLQIP